MKPAGVYSNVAYVFTTVVLCSALPLLHAQEDTSYRHGLVPMIGSPLYNQQQRISAHELRYGGGIYGVGVTTGKEKVYLVFWGNQWGTESTNSKGYETFSGDKDGVAPDLQAFFAGLGNTGDLWSGIMTTYCQGVAAGTIKCPSTAMHVAYPTGGALAGVWEDTSAASPAEATAQQLGKEAVKAAQHFGNTTNASNRDAQYIVISPTGSNPDNYKQGGFCAWHDFTGDTSLGSIPGPMVAFTNLPYIPDAGPNCGAGIVNPGNILDGVTIVGGHEYAETITDQYPAGGWIAPNGDEAADLCAWKDSGPGHMQNLVLTTGTFAIQGIWSNTANEGNGGCLAKHAIIE